MSSMMALIFAMRIKAYKKAAMYVDDDNNATDLEFETNADGCYLCGGGGRNYCNGVFEVVNETLVGAVVSCILLFIYILKLSLFELKNPGLIGNKKHHIDYSCGGIFLLNLT